MARLERPSKFLTPYGDLEKNFKFLKEVKILSKIFRNKLAGLRPIYDRGRRPPGIPPEVSREN